MPRLLFNTSIITEKFTTTVGATAGFLLVCAALLLACASHSQPWRRIMGSMSFRRSEPVMSIYQVQPGVGEEPCIWQKGILMGEKCQMPDYSGVITYDTAGNLVAPGRPRAVPNLNW
ncbi:hypothetical protein LUZ62_021247 [Rhynchospora pubera]|uniref:Uncharacterized protein n=1 Tax=Rhynchospora pubera TaxID=906938 RepID=A0AAV8GYM2_9POAL|nr:hypothetical protein LUZ62_021247 [Rhynchospora pubera]